MLVRIRIIVSGSHFKESTLIINCCRFRFQLTSDDGTRGWRWEFALFFNSLPWIEIKQINFRNSSDVSTETTKILSLTSSHSRRHRCHSHSHWTADVARRCLLFVLYLFFKTKPEKKKKEKVRKLLLQKGISRLFQTIRLIYIHRVLGKTNFVVGRGNLRSFSDVMWCSFFCQRVK